jgi:hypothetical protein
MIPPEKLRFRARGTAMVQHYERLDAGINAFVGRKFGQVKDQPGRHGFIPSNETDEVPYRAEYVKACADGDLYPADEETAKACNHYAKAHGLPCVKFDATFGAEGATAGPSLPATAEPTNAPAPSTSSNAPAGKPEKG